MTFTTGERVFYPAQGPCLIGAVEMKMVAGRATSFYRLTLLDENGGAVFVPVDKVKALHIRHLIDKSEIPKVLRYLQKSGGKAKNWRQRELDNTKLLSSGSAFFFCDKLGVFSSSQCVEQGTISLSLRY